MIYSGSGSGSGSCKKFRIRPDPDPDPDPDPQHWLKRILIMLGRRHVRNGCSTKDRSASWWSKKKVKYYCRSKPLSKGWRNSAFENIPYWEDTILVGQGHHILFVNFFRRGITFWKWNSLVLTFRKRFQAGNKSSRKNYGKHHETLETGAFFNLSNKN